MDLMSSPVNTSQCAHKGQSAGGNFRISSFSNNIISFIAIHIPPTSIHSSLHQFDSYLELTSERFRLPIFPFVEFCDQCILCLLLYFLNTHLLQLRCKIIHHTILCTYSIESNGTLSLSLSLCKYNVL